MNVELSRPFVQVNNVTTFTSLVFHAIRQNSHLKLTFVNNVVLVSDASLFDHPFSFLHLDRFHALVNHLALLVGNISEHDRCLNGFFNTFLLGVGFGRSQFLDIKWLGILRRGFGALGLELGNFLRFFLGNVLSNRFDTTGVNSLFLKLFVTFFVFFIVVFQFSFQFLLHALGIQAKVHSLGRGIRSASRGSTAGGVVADLINENDNNGNIIGSQFVL
mmetsp:Transcript_4102/g.11186  ORF Transcript_4102/g.11186 Transcript_4102/m.11186 type:complete len:218 (+) Transcript_4102:806-1459(+)